MDLTTLTISEYHKAIKDGKVTTKDLVAYYLDRIRKFDGTLNAIITINDQALSEAEHLDQYFQSHGFKGLLHGVPILLKDNVHTKDMVTTAGSKSLEGFIPDTDADIVRKMRQEGAIILAKTNLHEFAIWGETISSILGQTYNPYDLTRTPGGSSGGTGASVAADFGMVGIGTDTINSIRSPSSANSLVGIRPTVGMVSKEGVVPYSNTQDVVGPIARTVSDAVILLESIKKQDVNQSQEDLRTHLVEEGMQGKKIGILKSFFGKESEHLSTNAAVDRVLAHMQQDGAELKFIDDVIDSNYLVSQVSVHLHDLKDHLNAYLSKLPQNAPVHSVSEIIASGKFHPGIEENLRKALKLSTESDDYKERLKKRKATQEMLLQLMDDSDVDALVYPHQKQLVCKVGESQLERNGVLASVTGFPSICVPAGFSEKSLDAPIGVPIGMEILGRPFEEGKIIEIAYVLEKYKIRQDPILNIERC